MESAYGWTICLSVLFCPLEESSHYPQRSHLIWLLENIPFLHRFCSPLPMYVDTGVPGLPLGLKSQSLAFGQSGLAFLWSFHGFFLGGFLSIPCVNNHSQRVILIWDLSLKIFLTPRPVCSVLPFSSKLIMATALGHFQSVASCGQTPDLITYFSGGPPSPLW